MKGIDHRYNVSLYTCEKRINYDKDVIRPEYGIEGTGEANRVLSHKNIFFNKTDSPQLTFDGRYGRSLVSSKYDRYSSSETAITDHEIFNPAITDTAMTDHAIIGIAIIDRAIMRLDHTSGPFY